MAIAPIVDEVVQGARLLNFLPYLKDEIEKMQGAVVATVRGHIDAGTLTPELSYNFWMEWNSYATLYKRFETKARLAMAQGDKKRAMMELSS